MNLPKLIAAGAFALALVANAASAEPAMMGEPVHPAPGPSFVPITPHYFDPSHTHSDFDYWQAKHDEELHARQVHEHDLAIRRAEADRLSRAEELEEQRRQSLQPAR